MKLLLSCAGTRVSTDATTEYEKEDGPQPSPNYAGLPAAEDIRPTATLPNDIMRSFQIFPFIIWCTSHSEFASRLSNTDTSLSSCHWIRPAEHAGADCRWDACMRSFGYFKLGADGMSAFKTRNGDYLSSSLMISCACTSFSVLSRFSLDLDSMTYGSLSCRISGRSICVGPNLLGRIWGWGLEPLSYDFHAKPLTLFGGSGDSATDPMADGIGRVAESGPTDRSSKGLPNLIGWWPGLIRGPVVAHHSGSDLARSTTDYSHGGLLNPSKKHSQATSIHPGSSLFALRSSPLVIPIGFRDSCSALGFQLDEAGKGVGIDMAIE